MNVLNYETFVLISFCISDSAFEKNNNIFYCDADEFLNILYEIIQGTGEITVSHIKKINEVIKNIDKLFYKMN